MVIGWIRCPKCGTQHIEDPGLLTVWFNYDNARQLAVAECPKCGREIEDRIEFESMVTFKMYGVTFKPLNERYIGLKEEEIDNWNITKELKEIGFNG